MKTKRCIACKKDKNINDFKDRDGYIGIRCNKCREEKRYG